MNPARGSVMAVALITLMLGGAVAWWVLSGEPGIDSVFTSQTPGTPAVLADFVTTPTSGVAPLAVAFAIKRDVGTVETIDYGDGTSATVSDFICGLHYCTRWHTFSQPGTYKVVYADAGGQAAHVLTITVTAAP